MSRVAIIRRNGLGDVLCGLPLVRYLKEQDPQAHVTLYVDERSQELIPYLVGPDAVIPISSHWNKYWSVVKTAWKERDKKFDLAISAKSSPMKLMNFFLLGLRADHRIAYVDGAWHSRWISKAVPHDPSQMRHQAVRSLNLINPTLVEIAPDLRPRLKGVSTRPLSSLPTLLISLSNHRIGSTLDLDKYVRLLSRLYDRKPFELVINCLPQDLEKGQKLKQLLGFPVQLHPTEKFSDFLSLIASVDALFIGDGGIMHLAACFDKNQLVLFGGTKVWEWAPLSDRAICIGGSANVNDIDEYEMMEKLYELW